MIVALYITSIFLLLIPLEYLLCREKIHVTTMNANDIRIVDGIMTSEEQIFPVKKLLSKAKNVRCVHAYYYKSFLITSNLVLEIEYDR